MAVAGLILSAIGTGVQIWGQISSTNAQKDAEAQRQKQMNLEASRQRRDVIRNQIMTRAMAVNTATNQGAGADGSSAIPGASGQISGRAGNQLVAGNQNQEIGNKIFAANRRAFDASIISSFGSGLSSLGGMFMSNAGTIDRVGQYNKQNGYF